MYMYINKNIKKEKKINNIYMYINKNIKKRE